MIATTDDKTKPHWRIWIVAPDEEIHVVPGLGDEVANNHTLTPLCYCSPTPEKLHGSGPLDDPVWCHNDPSWPGSGDRFN